MAETYDSVRDTYERRIREIRDNRDLSDEGRRRQMAQAKVDADKRFKALRADEHTAREQRRDNAMRRLFGRTQNENTLEYRDALARADQIKNPADAASLLRVARLSGDDSLQRAVAMKALDGSRGTLGGQSNAWADVVDDWASSDEHRQEALHELSNIDAVGVNRQARLQQRLLDSVSKRAMKPAELEGHNVEHLAYQADEHDASETA